MKPCTLPHITQPEGVPRGNMPTRTTQTQESEEYGQKEYQESGNKELSSPSESPGSRRRLTHMPSTQYLTRALDSDQKNLLLHPKDIQNHPEAPHLNHPQRSPRGGPEPKARGSPPPRATRSPVTSSAERKMGAATEHPLGQLMEPNLGALALPMKGKPPH